MTLAAVIAGWVVLACVNGYLIGRIGGPNDHRVDALILGTLFSPIVCLFLGVVALSNVGDRHRERAIARERQRRIEAEAEAKELRAAMAELEKLP